MQTETQSPETATPETPGPYHSTLHLWMWLLRMCGTILLWLISFSIKSRISQGVAYVIFCSFVCLSNIPSQTYPAFLCVYLWKLMDTWVSTLWPWWIVLSPGVPPASIPAVLQVFGIKSPLYTFCLFFKLRYNWHRAILRHILYWSDTFILHCMNCTLHTIAALANTPGFVF